VGQLTEILVIAFAAIFVLNTLLLERNGLLRKYIGKNLFSDHFRLCSLAALLGVTVVAVGNFVYRGGCFPLVKVPAELLVLIAVGWAVLNSVSEEFIYRGLLMSRLEENMGIWGAILLQGLFFSIAHFWTKVPLGIPGALVSFAFAIGLGWLVKKTGDLSAAIFVHFWVDMALFVTVFIRQ